MKRLEKRSRIDLEGVLAASSSDVVQELQGIAVDLCPVDAKEMIADVLEPVRPERLP